MVLKGTAVGSGYSTRRPRGEPRRGRARPAPGRAPTETSAPRRRTALFRTLRRDVQAPLSGRERRGERREDAAAAPPWVPPHPKAENAAVLHSSGPSKNAKLPLPSVSPSLHHSVHSTADCPHVLRADRGTGEAPPRGRGIAWRRTAWRVS